MLRKVLAIEDWRQKPYCLPNIILYFLYSKSIARYAPMLIFISSESQPITYWLSRSYAPSSILHHFMPSFGAFHAAFWAILHTKTAYIVCRFDYEISPHALSTPHHLSFMRPCPPPKRGFKQLSRVHTFLLSASLKEPINWIYKAFFALASIAFLPCP